MLDTDCMQADFVCHLAGVNRPKDVAEFMEGNFGFTTLLDTQNTVINHQILVTSVQTTLDNHSEQKAGEDLIFSYSEETGTLCMSVILPNALGSGRD